MNKRIRKKKHMGEFKELGFQLRATLRSDLSGDEVDAVMERMLQLVEARHLEFGGGVHREVSGYVTRAEGGSATDEDRAALAAFFKADPAVTESEIAELNDAWL